MTVPDESPRRTFCIYEFWEFQRGTRRLLITPLYNGKTAVCQVTDYWKLIIMYYPKE